MPFKNLLERHFCLVRFLLAHYHQIESILEMKETNIEVKK